MKIISLFNHKGGVSKTTTAFNLGWMLAEHGHRTLVVDADPQCNLTALILAYTSVEDFVIFYSSHQGCDISTGLDPVMSGRLTRLSGGKPIPTSNENLYLYCGNIALSEVEPQISVAITTKEALPVTRNVPGSIGALLRITARENEIDYIIVDMSPSIGALNECILMSSDFFIIPTSPDFFCAQAIKSLSSVIPRWNEEIDTFRSEVIEYSIPKNPPKFLGFISQRYRPRNGVPARSFQNWIDIISIR